MAGPDAVALRRDLLRWYRREARDLAWRRTTDPYAVWVSEIMLQQTRVDVATPYFLRWMQLFPTLGHLAKADPEKVLQAWSGLGYYSRARNLHAAARLVVHEGMPDTAAGLRELPGIGVYTAGAIASIAFGERVPAVDGNVMRVLARLHAWPGAANEPALKGKVDEAAARIVPKSAPGDWNQALMDLGATVCTPRNPRCDECPVAVHCAAKAQGLQASIPAAKRTSAVRVERRAYAVVERAGKLLLVRNPSKGLLAGLWSLPGGPAERPLPELVLEQSGVAVKVRPRPQSARHQFSHRTWEMAVHRADVVGTSPVQGKAETAWVRFDELDAQAIPSAMRAALDAVGVGAIGVPKPKRRQGSGQS
ncbi:MAG: A/G-specific adenine glycosylase [Thermoplasmatota archaeon]